MSRLPLSVEAKAWCERSGLSLSPSFLQEPSPMTCPVCGASGNAYEVSASPRPRGGLVPGWRYECSHADCGARWIREFCHLESWPNSCDRVSVEEYEVQGG